MHQIKDLVATTISEQLFTKIQKGIAIKGLSSVKLYVSTQGDDNNDGTEAKPFKTIHKALLTAFEKYHNASDVKHINIMFLTDMTDNSNILIDNKLLGSKLWFNANNHNVVLNTVHVRGTSVEFKGCTFKPQELGAESSAITITQKAFCTLRDCTFLQSNQAFNQYIICTDFSYVIIQGESNINVGATQLNNSFISAFNKSTISLSNGSLNLKSNMTAPYFFIISRQSECYWYLTATTKANTFTVNGKKYLVNLQSNLNTIGRGEVLLLGNQAGVIEKDGKVY